MIQFGYKIDTFKGMFFNPAMVESAADKASMRALSRFGAFVMRRARTSIRKRQGPSKPGQPPHSHLGLLRGSILFGYDRSNQSVVIGPTLLNQLGFNKDGESAKGTVPELLEYGGTARIFEVQTAGGRWKRADLRARRRIAAIPDSRKRWRVANYEARPYMQPAFEAELPQAPAHWRVAA